MRGGFKKLVNPPTRLGDVDLEATRAERERVHKAVRDRQLIEGLLAVHAPGEGGISVRPLEISFVDGDGLPSEETAAS